MKKITSILIILAITILNPMFVFAADIATEMTEQEFLDSVAEIMHNYNADPEEAIGRLARIDAYLEGEPQSTTFEAPNTSNSRAFQPSNYTITLYHAKRGTDGKTHYLMWELDRTFALELNSNPLDFISLEWDTTYASYHSANADGVITTLKGRDVGIVLFNIEDNHFNDVDYAYGSVRVTRVQSGDMLFGAKYTHTYISFGLTGTVTSSFDAGASILANSIPGFNISASKGYTIAVTGKTVYWELYADKWASL